METEPKSNYAMPVAIVIAGVIIAGAIYFGDTSKVKNDTANNVPTTQSDSLDKINPITKTDHIRGNPNAPVIIVEYSDTECPFCGRFHETMKRIMDEYGKAGKVAWVYRHYPLDQLHPKARHESVALECAYELGGNEKFWEYTDRIYSITPANNGLDVTELPKIAEFVGLDVAKFNTCLASTKHDARIEADIRNASLTGGNGTPWSIIISKDGKKTSLNGAYPYENVKQIIDSLLK
jgi:protein-disulfide isomerase